MATKVGIANSALILLGAETIQAITESNKRAKLCNEMYDKSKRKLLELHPWNFATLRVALAQLAGAPVYEFDNWFQIPNDCLRILRVENNEAVTYVIEKDKILTNEDAISIEYISDIGEGYFTQTFAELLAARLAADICYALLQSTSYAQYLEAKFDKDFALTRSRDAQEGTARSFNPNYFLQARRGNFDSSSDFGGF